VIGENLFPIHFEGICMKKLEVGELLKMGEEKGNSPSSLGRLPARKK